MSPSLAEPFPSPLSTHPSGQGLAAPAIAEPPDPGVAARAKLRPKERRELDERLRRCMSFWGQHGLSELLDQGASVDAKYSRGPSKSIASPIWGMSVSMLSAQKLGSSSQNALAFPAMERILRICDPHAVDRQGLTPLMHAASEGSLGVEALAPRSNLLAVCGDMGKDFDAGWPALFFAVNTRTGRDGLARKKELCALLAHPGVWSLRSREGLDVFDCAQRFGPAPQIVACLQDLRAMHAAQAQAREIDASIPRATTLPCAKKTL